MSRGKRRKQPLVRAIALSCLSLLALPACSGFRQAGGHRDGGDGAAVELGAGGVTGDAAIDHLSPPDARVDGSSDRTDLATSSDTSTGDGSADRTDAPPTAVPTAPSDTALDRPDGSGGAPVVGGTGGNAVGGRGGSGGNGAGGNGAGGAGTGGRTGVRRRWFWRSQRCGLRGRCRRQLWARPGSPRQLRRGYDHLQRWQVGVLLGSGKDRGHVRRGE